MGERCICFCLNTFLPSTPSTANANSSATIFSRLRNTTRRNFRVQAGVSDRFLASTSHDESFYDLLGISESVSLSEIKQAYKQKARKYHPDVSPPDRIEENTKRFIRLQEAYETLSDPSRRALYDGDLARGLHLAFSARRRFNEGLEDKNLWRNRCQSQVAELKRRSESKDFGENMSWGARMRRQRNSSSNE